MKLLGKGDVALDLAQGCPLSLTPDVSSRPQPRLAYAEKHGAVFGLDSGTALEFNGKIGSWHKTKVNWVQRAKDELLLWTSGLGSPASRGWAGRGAGVVVLVPCHGDDLGT